MTPPLLWRHSPHLPPAMPRLDQALVERGLCESREKARRAIMAGQGTHNQPPPPKPPEIPHAPHKMGPTAQEKNVSPGGVKMEHTISHLLPRLTRNNPLRFVA